jgi:AraC-like DNA-binding protein
LAIEGESFSVGTLMMRPPTVLAGIASTLMRSLIGAGVSRGQIEARVGLKEKDVADADERIPLTMYERLWSTGSSVLRDPTFGLRAGADRSESSLGILGYLAMSSRHLGEALERCTRLFKLIDESQTMRVEYGQRTVAISRERDLGVSAERDDAFFASIFSLAQRWTRRRILPLELTVLERPHLNLAPHRHFFSCMAVTSGTASRIVFAREHLDRSLVRADAQLGRYLERIAEHQLQQLRYENELVRQLLRFFESVGEQSDRSLDAAARALGTSRRTLQRRLEENGLVYRDILDTARRRQALEVLHTNVTVRDAASALGYADLSSFRRAVRRWTGMSPTAYQRSFRTLKFGLLT